MPNYDQKLAGLRERLRGLGQLVVAFSGGVDSTFLSRIAHEEIGDGLVLVTAVGAIHPERERESAASFARQLGVEHVILEFDERQVPEFIQNPPDRCYHCKHALLRMIWNVARERGIPHVADGTNTDDEGDYRPGLRALSEHNVISPLRNAGLGKSEIRALSAELGLPTADLPAAACLASRFPYGHAITREGLAAVEKVENELHARGFTLSRARHHGTVVRIEVAETDMNALMANPTRAQILSVARAAGFTYVALDLQGYRQGSMNETHGT